MSEQASGIQQDLTVLADQYEAGELSDKRFDNMVNQIAEKQPGSSNRTATVTEDAQPSDDATPLTDLAQNATDWMTDKASLYMQDIKTQSANALRIALVAGTIMSPTIVQSETPGMDNQSATNDTGKTVKQHQAVDHEPGDLLYKNGTLYQVAGQPDSTRTPGDNAIADQFKDVVADAKNYTAVSINDGDQYLPSLNLNPTVDLLLVDGLNRVDEPSDDHPFQPGSYFINNIGVDNTYDDSGDVNINPETNSRHDTITNEDGEVIGLFDYGENRIITDSMERATEFQGKIQTIEDIQPDQMAPESTGLEQ